MSPRAPAAPLPSLNIYDARTKPLNPRKSMIEIVTSNAIRIGCTIIYIFKFFLFLHMPVYPEYLRFYLYRKRRG